ncbi:MAG: glycerol-3-phosphate dehydrogenase/oxidase [Balneolales bacterium]
MRRSDMIQSVKQRSEPWDFIIIGGGATGLGVAVDAANRGYSTLLVEMDDFAKGTSSRSTKLVHGGIRYLQQGNVSLVLDALKERNRLLNNAPHLVHSQPFLIPNYRWWEKSFYGFGMKIYDTLAGKQGFGRSKRLSRTETLERASTLSSKKLKGGVLYYDGQFDDSRLAINLAETSAEKGGVLINYMKVTGLLKNGGKVYGVKVKDALSGKDYEIKGRTVINATGVFTDSVLQLDDRDAKPIISPSQGIHLVLDKKFLPGNTAIMVPHTDDGRILFAVPWHNKVVLGTTDTAVNTISTEPKAMHAEIDFLLKHATGYLAVSPGYDDIKSVFAGLRPLVKASNNKKTAKISRDHTLIISDSGLVTITGGKWTTYRKMAQDVVDQASDAAGLPSVKCTTENLRIHGWQKDVNTEDPLHIYGTDQAGIKEIVAENPEWGSLLHKRLPYIKAEVIWAIRNEMAMTVEDFNARRSRALLLDASASEEMAPEVARLMAEEAGYDDNWVKKQLKEYYDLVSWYKYSENKHPVER